MQDIICELQDMKHLDWAARKMSPGTPGCFLKAYEEVNGKRLYTNYRTMIVIEGCLVMSVSTN